MVTGHFGAEGRDHAHVRPGLETYLGERRGDSIAFARAVVDEEPTLSPCTARTSCARSSGTAAG